MSRVVLWPLLAGTVVGLLLHFVRGFFPRHALIIGLAVAALVYAGIRTVDRLRDLYRGS